MKFRDKLAAFFYGRYGVDQLYKFLMVVWFVLMIANIVVSRVESLWVVSIILSILSMTVLVFMFFRVLSKNLAARRAENDRFLKLWSPISGWFSLQKRRFKERKTHSFKKCPHCKKTVRMKKTPGEHTARCPLCGGTFKVKFR